MEEAGQERTADVWTSSEIVISSFFSGVIESDFYPSISWK